MTYELILTTDCNRKCAFCYVNKTKPYYATSEDVDKFVNYIQEHGNITDQISIFGGEPTCHPSMLYYAIRKIKALDIPFPITIYTNGDNITYYAASCFYDLHFSITTYDFLNNPKRYITLARGLLENNDVTFSYTFTSKDIQYYEHFIRFCDEARVNHKIAFSHSPESWTTLQEHQIERKISEIYDYEFQLYFERYNKDPNTLIPCLIDKYLKRGTQLLIDYIYNSISNPINCSQSKLSFFKGNVIGHCIRCLYQKINSSIIPKKCQTCDYLNYCDKSCIAEYKNNDINSILCLIEKLGFETFFKYVSLRKQYPIINHIITDISHHPNILS